MRLSSEYTGRGMLVALSGGCDSVALLLLLRDAGATVHAAHCNFHLRGAESDRDERFCRDLCQGLGVPFHIAHFDTLAHAQLHRQSIETAARELRYAWFEQLRRDLALDGIAVAHHRDDQAETVLMHLVRGCGLHGLTGMRPVSGHIVRPLLHHSRRELEQFLRERGQDYVTDSTNLERDAARNRVRLDIMPALEGVNSAAAQHIADCADRLARVERLVDDALRRAASRVSTREGDTLSIDTGLLKDEPSPADVLHHLLAPLGFTAAQVESVARCLDAPTGRTHSSATHTLTHDRGRLLASARREPPRTLVIPEEGAYRLADGRLLRVATAPAGPGFQPSRQPLTATLDADRAPFPLTLRPVREGDRFQPFGMAGTKLVSDYLTDRHTPLPDKQQQTVLTRADGTIVWLTALRTAHTARITADTRRVLTVALEGAEDNGDGVDKQWRGR